jgi:hypothetical protein
MMLNVTRLWLHYAGMDETTQRVRQGTDVIPLNILVSTAKFLGCISHVVFHP